MALAKARITVEHTGRRIEVMFNPEGTASTRTTTTPRRRFPG